MKKPVSLQSKPLKKGDRVYSFSEEPYQSVSGTIVWLDDNLVRIKPSFGEEKLVQRRTVRRKDG